jgi:hypothetical protein
MMYDDIPTTPSPTRINTHPQPVRRRIRDAAADYDAYLYNNAQPRVPRQLDFEAYIEPPDAQPQVDANQIHKAMGKIKLPELIICLKDNLGIDKTDVPKDRLFASNINDTLTSMIEANYDQGSSDENKYKTDVGRIMNDRLNGLNYSDVSYDLKEIIFLSLEYAKEQSRTFQQMYVHSFTQDTTCAYGSVEAGTAEMSCSAGALERLVLSLDPACISEMEKIRMEKYNSDNDSRIYEYEKIHSILSKNIEQQIPLLIQEWYKTHDPEIPYGDKVKFPDDVGDDLVKRRQHLKDHVVQGLMNEPNEEEERKIEQQIQVYADAVGLTDLHGGRRRKKKTHKRSVERKKGCKRSVKRKKGGKRSAKRQTGGKKSAKRQKGI